jgi:hypothetical protein
MSTLRQRYSFLQEWVKLQFVSDKQFLTFQLDIDSWYIEQGQASLLVCLSAHSNCLAQPPPTRVYPVYTWLNVFCGTGIQNHRNQISSGVRFSIWRGL